MIKKITLFLTIGLFPLLAVAQWSSTDSLSLKQILKTDGEIRLNKNAIKKIDFGTLVDQPKSVEEKLWLDVDISLPKVFPEKVIPVLTLRPYNNTTKYNYDPIYQKKILVTKDTWKHGDVDAWKYGGKVYVKQVLVPSNWAKKPTDPGIRRSIDEIEATGLRYNPLAGRANGKIVGAWETAGGSGIVVGPGGSVMALFTKNFWDKSGRNRRKRTLELLQNYGDSTTVQINEEIKIPIMR